MHTPLSRKLESVEDTNKNHEHVEAGCKCAFPPPPFPTSRIKRKARKYGKNRPSAALPLFSQLGKGGGGGGREGEEEKRGQRGGRLRFGKRGTQRKVYQSKGSEQKRKKQTRRHKGKKLHHTGVRLHTSAFSQRARPGPRAGSATGGPSPADDACACGQRSQGR